MTPVELALLALAGLAAGAVNSIAGGGSLVVFPALLAVGLPPLQANVTNSVAQWPGYLGGVFGFRAELRGQRRRLPLLMVAAALGSTVGCVLLLTLPDAAFDAVVPALVIAASVFLALQPRIRAWATSRSSGSVSPGGVPTEVDPGSTPHPVRLFVAVFVAGVYGGYFGGALGVILIGTLALMLSDRLGRINALKTGISLVAASVTVVAFGLFGPVDWLAVLVIAPATLLGGLVGARLALRIRDDVLRWVVVALGLAVGAYLVLRALDLA